jgi:ribosomal protein S18 acetylase RimI-like enzyme
MHIEYRIAGEDDVTGLLKLGVASYGQFRDLLDDEYWQKLKSFLNSEGVYSDLLAKSLCFVGVVDQQIVGMAFLILSGNPTDIFEAGWSYLRMVGVHPDFEGRGIGTRLMQLCIDHAKMKGEKSLALHTSEFMDSARHIYEKMGFVQIKELERRLGKRYWLYQLAF